MQSEPLESSSCIAGTTCNYFILEDQSEPNPKIASRRKECFTRSICHITHAGATALSSPYYYVINNAIVTGRSTESSGSTFGGERASDAESDHGDGEGSDAPHASDGAAQEEGTVLYLGYLCFTGLQ